MTIRLAILFDNFGPYHIARMLGAAAHCEVTAVEAAPSRSEYAWRKPEVPAPLTYLPLHGVGSLAQIIAEIDTQLGPLGPNCIAIPGWSSHAALAAILWSAKQGIPAILMSETNAWDFARRPMAEWVKRRIVSHFSSGLVSSDSQAEYLVDLGMAPDAIFRGYNAVDNAYFKREAARQRAAKDMPTPLAEGMRGRYFLTSNRFIEKKNLLRLLDAYAHFRNGRGDDPDDWPLVLLGDGALRSALEDKRNTLGLDRHVLMPGFRQIDELPLFYGTAGAFVHASTTEQWGLVVNEAMASGVPVAVSIRCGCAEVLVENGVTGLTFDPYDTSAIAEVLTRLTDTSFTKNLARDGLARVDAFGPARFGTGVTAAARMAIRRPVAPSLLDRAICSVAARRST